jgi:hypothetical protein
MGPPPLPVSELRPPEKRHVLRGSPPRRRQAFTVKRASGWAVGEHGKGEMWLQNGNGVYLRLKARRQGLALSLGADGMAVRRKEQGRGSEHAPTASSPIHLC